MYLDSKGRIDFERLAQQPDSLDKFEEIRSLNVAQRTTYGIVVGGFLKNRGIIDAFSEVDRSDFLTPNIRQHVFADQPLPILASQTNSQPSIVAEMLEMLEPEPEQKILDVGAGSGWTTALLSYCVKEQGEVVGTERISELVRFGNANLQKYSHTGNAKIRRTPKRLGYKDGAPYDSILVSAGAEDLPVDLLRQLKQGVVLFYP